MLIPITLVEEKINRMLLVQLLLLTAAVNAAKIYIFFLFFYKKKEKEKEATSLTLNKGKFKENKQEKKERKRKTLDAAICLFVYLI